MEIFIFQFLVDGDPPQLRCGHSPKPRQGCFSPANVKTGRRPSAGSFLLTVKDLWWSIFWPRARSYLLNPFQKLQTFFVGNAVVVVVIVSMGLLITVLAVGVVKLKSVASRDLCDEADSVEMGWEDSANTNITINPLEVIYIMKTTGRKESSFCYF